MCSNSCVAGYGPQKRAENIAILPSCGSCLLAPLELLV